MQRIRSFFGKIGAWWKRQRTLAKLAIIVALVIGAFVALGNGKDESVVIETVKRQDLARTVTASGTVVSSTDLSLSFQETNLVKSVQVTVGQRVYPGQVLATLANGSEAAAVASAQGELLAAQARERKIREGDTDEKTNQARVKFENARRELYSDELTAEPDPGNLSEVAPAITGVYTGTQEGEYRIEFYRTLGEIRFSGIETGTARVSELAKPFGTKGLFIQFPEGGYSFGSEWKVKIPNKNGANYATNLSAYRAAEAELALATADVRSADIDEAVAETARARAQVSSAQAAYEKTVVRAPAAGTVTKVDIKLGQLAEAFDPVITIQDVGNLYVEANVNESNISNIALGQPVTVTYDALPAGTATLTSISSVDLSATVTDGIVNYEVKAVLPDPTLIRPGMTANLSIQTAFAPGVLIVPERVIETKEGVQTVQVLVDEQKMETRTQVITTGLRGDGGLIEVTSGLSEGERVVFTAR